MARFAKYINEFIGMFIFVFAVVSVVHTNPTLAPLAIGSTLMVLVYAGGHISGGHYNPAVSLAAFVRGVLSAQDLALYWGVQLAGAAAAAGVGDWVFGRNQPAAAYSGKPLAIAFVVELIFTFALAWVVLNVATSKETEGNSFYGLAIGFTVVVGAFAVGALSGGAFNPAIGFGICIAGLTSFGNFWIYVVADLLGAAVAGLLFKALQPAEA